MNILHVINSTQFSGTQTIIKGIMAGDKENNHLYYAVKDSPVPALTIDNKVSYCGNIKSAFTFKPIKQIRSLILLHKIEVIQCHLFRSQVYGWIVKRLFFPRLLLVFHQHALLFPSNEYPGYQYALYRLFLKVAKHDVTKWIAVSEVTKDKLVTNARIPVHKVEIIPNFVDLTKFQPGDKNSARKQLNLPVNKYLIGFSGRLTKVKGWDVFIEAIKNAIAEGVLNDIHFVIAGDGQDKNSLLLSIQAQKLANYLTYLGYMDNLQNYYHAIDCAIVPSQWESFGLPIIEANACAVPVIASQVSGISELVQDNGLLFKQGDVGQLISQIKAVHDNKQLSDSLIRNGLLYARNFTLDTYIRRLNHFYQSL